MIKVAQFHLKSDALIYLASLFRRLVPVMDARAREKIP